MYEYILYFVIYFMCFFLCSAGPCCS